MQTRLNMLFTAGLFVAVCAAILLPAGCESSSRQVAATDQGSGPTPVCPLCGQVTRTMPLTGLKYTTCVCPSCREVWKLDEDTAMTIERAYGHEPGLMATVCEGCGAVVQECAVCQQARG